MSISVTLRQTDARLAYLAIAYHLARPGSELDPQTRTRAQHGLAEVARQLQPQLQLASVTLELEPFQLERLGSAILGTVNELKVYPMLEERSAEEGGGRRSMVAGFDQTLRHLFAQVEEDAGEAVALVEPLIALKRRLDEAAGAEGSSPAEAKPPGRPPRWRFWRRS